MEIIKNKWSIGGGRGCEARTKAGSRTSGAFRRTVLVGGSDLGGRRGDRKFSALGWRFAALCRLEGVIWVVGGEVGNLEHRGGVSLHCGPGMASGLFSRLEPRRSS